MELREIEKSEHRKKRTQIADCRREMYGCFVSEKDRDFVSQKTREKSNSKNREGSKWDNEDRKGAANETLRK